MSTLALSELPDVQKKVATRHLFAMKLKVCPLQSLGATPAGGRRIGLVSGGVFEGERLSGEVLDGGADWQALRADGVLTLDVRLVLKTDDGDLIGMTYHGLRHGAADVLQRIDRGERVDPAEYYFRTSPTFETASKKYEWLNRILAVGVGDRTADGPVYSVFEIL